MKRSFLFICLMPVIPFFLQAQQKPLAVESPDHTLKVTIQVDADLTWTLTQNANIIVEKSPVGMELRNGQTLGKNARVVSSRVENHKSTIEAVNYKKDVIQDEYQELVVQFKNNFGLTFRVYNEGVAYRFTTSAKDSVFIKNEIANFNFTGDHTCYIPYVNDAHNHDVFQTSFENNYQHIKISEFKKDTLAFAPILVELDGGLKAAVTEADLEEYPGMFLQAHANGFHGVYASYPISEVQGGHNNLQSYVVKRADYIAKTTGKRNFPWRVVIVSKNDSELLNNDMVYKLASPSRLTDVSWIKPGKVAWDWWNDWNITGVDFKAGVNTATYKYYIDFASQYKIENILLDEGWATSDDIMEIVPEINLQEIIDYARSKNVGVWLWGGWLPLDKQVDHALSTYSKMGIKGFKIDFMDRDDQKMVQFYYRFAKKAAEYKLMLDFHGAYKPTGLQRTFPNVMNFEGVRGLENVKWSNTDFPGYDCTIPFIRMLAGPMDYTPGAMRNANKWNFRAIHSSPMSQGTRCHQLALYVIFESPFEMLADNPTVYQKEKACTSFIASVPTVFDQTVALGGEVGKYAAIARRKESTWYVGAITNWDARNVNIDLSFLGSGNFEMEFFFDGPNAERDGTDFKTAVKQVTSSDKLPISLAAGGGWAAKIYPKK